MAEEYNYGDPIPEQYRGRLFEWEGGGYDGCFWEMNQGLVDKDGHWHPIYSTGHDGIDASEWFDRKIDSLKADLGYDVRPPSVQYDEKLRAAARKVFGDQWWRHWQNDVDPLKDPRVLEVVREDKAKLDEYERVSREYAEERQHREDHMFMMALERVREEERPTEVGLLDDEHIKETCRVFCERYEGNVGMMTNCLDKLAGMGYDAWCTCTDCGEQFQTLDFPNFSSLIDDNCYHGDGGIGVIMGRVLCEDCHGQVECPSCYEPDLPNPRDKDQDRQWRNYDFLACLIHDWIGVCWGCASGFEDDKIRDWSKECGMLVETELGERYVAEEEQLKKAYDLDGHKLYEVLKLTNKGKRKINELRDMLEDAMRSYFVKDDYDDVCESLPDRYEVEPEPEKDDRQQELPLGMDSDNQKKEAEDAS